MPPMYDLTSRSSPDTATSYAVCDGVGERLRDTLKGVNELPPRLSELLHRLEEQERQDETGG
ncbi:MAG: hypothetical protein ACOY4O_13360 [Pseudomonadota bacterium]